MSLRERLEALVGELGDEIGHGEGIYGDADAVLASVADRLTALLAEAGAEAGPSIQVTMDGPGEQVAAALPEALAALRELGPGWATVTLTGQELAWAVGRLGLSGVGIESAVLHVRSGVQAHPAAGQDAEAGA